MPYSALQSVILDLYASTTQPGAIGPALDRVAALFQAPGIMIGPLVRGSAPDPRLVAYASEAFHEAIPEYINHFVALNPRKEFLTRQNARDLVFTDLDIVSADEIRTDEFYNDFLLRHKFMHCLDRVSSAGFGGDTVWVSLQYGDDTPPPETERRKLFSYVTDHVMQALRLHRDLAATAMSVADRELVTQIDRPALIVDASRKIIAMNAAAVALERQGLSFRSGALSAVSAQGREALRALIMRAADLTSADRAMVAIPVAGHLMPLFLRATPLVTPDPAQAIGGLLHKECRYLVVASDLDTPRAGDPSHALRMLGLTAAEARLAALVGQGLSPDEAAAQAGITVATARVHLRRVHDKLGIRRQAELIRLIAALPV